MNDNDHNDDDVRELNERDPRLLRRILFGAVAAVLICLVGYLVFNIFTTDGGDLAGEPPSPTAIAAEDDSADDGGDDDSNTPTPTRVIDETTPTPTEEPDEPTATPTPTTAPTVIAQPPDESQDTLVSFEPGPAAEIIQNGGFDEGFASNGVGLEWSPFKNDDVIAAYAAEASDSVYIAAGQSAQRIALSQAKQGNRYAGIYQQLDVIEGETYTLSMKGQIRTGVGDADKTSFGYRMQYAISQRGVRNWEVVPDEAWIELPWDEQMLGDAETKFFDYETEIVPESDQITLFIRAWNKWPDPGLAEYTIDSISLIGPSVVSQTLPQAVADDSAGQAFEPAESSTASTDSSTGDQMVDQGLPTTGVQSGAFTGDGRFWGAVLVLVLLAVGATYRAKWTA